MTELLPGFPGSRAGLVPGDTILKVNDTELTRESIPNLGKLLAGEAGTKVRLTVRHPGSEKPAVIELTRERFVNDPATGELLYPLRALVNERLAKAPRDAGLLELRAELAGQWSDSKAQVADYTAAIEALAQQKPEAAAADLKRLYGRRGNALRRPEAVAAGGRRLRPCRDRRDNRRGLAIQSGDGTGGGDPFVCEIIAEMDRAQAGRSEIRAGRDLLPAS